MVAGQVANPRLLDESFNFASDLNITLEAIFGEDVQPFRTTRSGDRVALMNSGVELRKAGTPVMLLIGQYLLDLDHRNTHLRVARSALKVVPVGVARPVFRYEYDEGYESSDYPAAHVQFHGEHVDLQAIMAKAWRKAKKKPPDVTHLHFPVGGTRYRPCLEDVLEMLIVEFDIELATGRRAALSMLRDTRAGWRERQLKSAVRDNPQAAIEALQALGYTRPYLRKNVTAPMPRPQHARRI